MPQARPSHSDRPLHRRLHAGNIFFYGLSWGVGLALGGAVYAVLFAWNPALWLVNLAAGGAVTATAAKGAKKIFLLTQVFNLAVVNLKNDFVAVEILHGHGVIETHDWWLEGAGRETIFVRQISWTSPHFIYREDNCKLRFMRLDDASLIPEYQTVLVPRDLIIKNETIVINWDKIATTLQVSRVMVVRQAFSFAERL